MQLQPDDFPPVSRDDIPNLLLFRTYFMRCAWQAAWLSLYQRKEHGRTQKVDDYIYLRCRRADQAIGRTLDRIHLIPRKDFVAYFSDSGLLGMPNLDNVSFIDDILAVISA